MTLSSLYQQLTDTCSSERLDSYRVSGGTEIDALAFYVWNTGLCESLYPALQNLEIGLRNRLNRSIAKSYGDIYWYKDTRILVDGVAHDKVAEAEAEITSKRKTITPARVVSELNFGFWTSLLSSKYDAVIWRRPGLLKDTFPYISKYIRKRHTLAGRFSEIRKLRNRVFHHEPIWARPNLTAEHDNLIEALGWLAPSLQKITASLDRFSIVNNEDYREELKHKLARACPVASKELIRARVRAE